MLNFMVVIAALFWITGLIMFLVGPTPEEKVKLALYSLYFLFYMIVWALGRRFTKQSAYFLLVLFVLTQAIKVLANARGLKEDSEKETSSTFLWGDTGIYCLFLSPSLAFLNFYLIVHTCFTLWFTSLQFDAGQENAWKTITYLPMALLTFFACVYILQKRELKRFFQQLEVEKKEQ